MQISIDRIMKDMDHINGINSTPGNGITRFSFSKEDRKAREYLLGKMEEMGLEVTVDGIGNIRAKLCTEGNREKPSIMIGSHIDTVQHGGKYDGLAGVILSLEVIRTIKENNIAVDKPIELIIFAEEEGSNFDIALLGSKAMTGKYSPEDLKNILNDENKSAYDLIKEFGLNIDEISNQTLKDGEIDAMIELHVEQGGILDNKSIPIGIVEAIAGMKTLKVQVQGVSNHAGSTPMNLRQDPLVATSDLILFINKTAKENAYPTTVATVGKIFNTPNRSNVIPKNVEFYVDVRDTEEKGIEMVKAAIIEKAKEVSTKYDVSVNVEEIGVSDVVRLSPRVVGAIEEAAKNKKIEYIRMNSGAVHDSVLLTGKTDVGMIFVPSIGGLSHCPEEETETEDLKTGAALLLETVIQLAAE